MAITKISLLVFFCILQLATAQLRVGFYNVSCPKTEAIVRQVVKNRLRRDRSITAALLRLKFHYCFVRGCDASILLDATSTTTAEKEAGPNFSVRGYDIIDDAKRQLEAVCPSTVSCADIISLATRDAVALNGGPSYSVPTGRRDGHVSNAFEVNLPGSDLSVHDALRFFTAKRLTLSDMVTLLGAHAVGITHCSFIRDRLFDFQGSGRPDRAMNPGLVATPRRACASRTRESRINLDQNTSSIVDNSFYNQLLNGKGVLKLDQNLGDDGLSRPLVSQLASDGNAFRLNFAIALIKLSKVEVLVGRAGEIRRNCRVVNPR